MKLIAEYTEQDIQCLVEAKEDGSKNYTIEGVFAQAEQKNRNGRIYPKMIMEKAVNKYAKEQVATKRAVGELNHPEGPTVNLDKVSHLITELKVEDKNVMGKATILGTPMGEIVKNLMDEGATLGVSSRGMGSLDQRGGANYVRSDFKLATAGDIVADPSAPNAFVEGIMEGKEWVWDHGNLVEAQVYEMKQRIEKRARLREDKLKALEFAKFMKLMSN